MTAILGGSFSRFAPVLIQTDRKERSLRRSDIPNVKFQNRKSAVLQCLLWLDGESSWTNFMVNVQQQTNMQTMSSKSWWGQRRSDHCGQHRHKKWRESLSARAQLRHLCSHVVHCRVIAYLTLPVWPTCTSWSLASSLISPTYSLFDRTALLDLGLQSPLNNVSILLHSKFHYF